MKLPFITNETETDFTLDATSLEHIHKPNTESLSILIVTALELSQFMRTYQHVRLITNPFGKVTAALLSCIHKLNKQELDIMPDYTKWDSFDKCFMRLMDCLPESSRSILIQEWHQLNPLCITTDFIEYDQELLAEWLLKATKVFFIEVRDLEAESKDILNYINRNHYEDPNRMIDLIQLIRQHEIL